MPIDLTRDLGVRKGDVLFVHASLDRLNVTASEAPTFLEQLISAVGGDGAIFMPSYPWLPPTLAPSEGAVFDVRRSPSRTGLLSEVFRRTPGVTRSEAFYLPVCGCGFEADSILADQVHVTNPFTPDSTLARIAQSPRAKVLGIGVSLNTTSFVHVIDHLLDTSRYGFQYYNDGVVSGAVRHLDGTLSRTSTLIVRDDVRRNMRPDRVFKLSSALRNALVRHDIGSAINFCYPLKLFVDEAIAMGSDALGRDQRVPWIDAGLR